MKVLTPRRIMSDPFLHMPEDGYSCPVCGGHHLQTDPGFCRKGHRLKFQQKGEIVDMPDDEALRHFNPSSQQFCWNGSVNLETGQYERHLLEIETEKQVSIQTGEIWDAQKCKHCKAIYGWYNGRQTTEAELASARAGKIPLKTQGAMVMGRNSP
jgi:hypothetical protein